MLHKSLSFFLLLLVRLVESQNVRCFCTLQQPVFISHSYPSLPQEVKKSVQWRGREKEEKLYEIESAEYSLPPSPGPEPPGVCVCVRACACVCVCVCVLVMSHSLLLWVSESQSQCMSHMLRMLNTDTGYSCSTQLAHVGVTCHSLSKETYYSVKRDLL